jgi:hypothetical protein
VWILLTPLRTQVTRPSPASTSGSIPRYCRVKALVAVPASSVLLVRFAAISWLRRSRVCPLRQRSSCPRDRVLTDAVENSTSEHRACLPHFGGRSSRGARISHSCKRCGTQAALKLPSLPSVDSSVLALGLAFVPLLRWSFRCRRPDTTGRASEAILRLVSYRPLSRNLGGRADLRPAGQPATIASNRNSSIPLPAKP